MMERPVGALIRFIGGFILAAAMLAITAFTDKELPVVIMALPYGVMGYDLATIIKALPIGGRK